MTEYPYDFGTGYKVQTVFANKTEAGIYGDVYDFRSEAEREHPGAEILTGYCVISETTGFVADGCNDWNDTISAAILDYEEHVVPLLERDEFLEMNCPVYDEEENFLYEAFFAVKSGWLQDYFGVEKRSQLEAIWDIGDSWEAPENFTDALEDAEHSGFQIKALVRDNVKVEWMAIGEGLHGDYDPEDPQDIELLRFSVSVLRDGFWEEKENASYCTQFPVSASAEEQVAGLQLLLGQFHYVLSPNIDISVKKLAEKMSWLDSAYVSGYMKALTSSPSLETVEPNAADNLIKAMIAYGMEYSWSDGEIIHALTDLGITYDDFCHAGAQDFAKDYLESQDIQLINDIKAQIIGRKNTTSYGEPQAWVSLSNGRSIEVTLEQEGLAEPEYYYSVRLHCSEREYENNDYYSTNGVIDQYASSGSTLDEIDKLVLAAISCNQKYPIARHNIDRRQENDVPLTADSELPFIKVEPKISTPQAVQYGIDDNWMHRGQKVKILDKHFAGQVGTIHAFIWNTGQYIVAMENGHTLPFNPSELEKVDERKLPFSKQVQSASIRATEAHASAAIDIKKLCEAYNRSDLEALLYLKNFCVGNDSRLIEDLINANLNFYEEGYHRKTAINNEGEYHVKKWDLFERFGVTRGLDDQMVPAIINAPTKDAINDR